MSNQNKVLEYNNKFGLAVGTKPEVPDVFVIPRLIDNISVPFSELQGAMWELEIVPTSEAIANLLYAVYGTAVACGIDADRVFQEVHKANMAKELVDGRVTNSENWEAPRIAEVINV